MNTHKRPYRVDITASERLLDRESAAVMLGGGRGDHRNSIYMGETCQLISVDRSILPQNELGYIR